MSWEEHLAEGDALYGVARRLEIIFIAIREESHIPNMRFNAFRSFENACARHGLEIEDFVGEDYAEYRAEKLKACREMLVAIKSDIPAFRRQYAAERLRDLLYLDQLSGLPHEEILTLLDVDEKGWVTLVRDLESMAPPQDEGPEPRV